jgi:hypothetical protein
MPLCICPALLAARLLNNMCEAIGYDKPSASLYAWLEIVLDSELHSIMAITLTGIDPGTSNIGGGGKEAIHSIVMQGQSPFTGSNLLWSNLLQPPILIHSQASLLVQTSYPDPWS